MIEIEGRFCRVHNKLPYVARVTVQVREDPTGPDILVRCSGTPTFSFSQGDLEDVPAVGYEDWKQGAVIGVRHALQVAERTKCRVTITRIIGMITDTNPTIVGAAAMNAVWTALEYSPLPAQVQQVESVVFGSWQCAYNALPNFDQPSTT